MIKGSYCVCSRLWVRLHVSSSQKYVTDFDDIWHWKL
jgi:hypothetical protein